MRILVTLFALFPAAVQAACPPLPERSARHTELMALVAEAATEQEARALGNELWEIWTTAPDEVAQGMLQSGMERRGSYDFAGAIEEFNRLVDYCPNYAEGYNQRAFISFIREDYAAALDDLDRAVALTPDHIGAVVGRALTLIELGRDLEGQIALRQALLLNPWLTERGLLTELPAPKSDAETDL